MNSCNFIGRMGANPKHYPGDANKKSTLIFSLAVKKTFQVKQGDPDCYWLNFKAFGNTADLLHKHVGKGQLVGVNCTANVETFKDQSKQDRTVTNFIVNQITFCEKSNGNADGAGANQGNPSNTSNGGGSNYQPSQTYNPADDDDLPF